MAAQSEKITGLYCRLSAEDGYVKYRTKKIFILKIHMLVFVVGVTSTLWSL